MSGHIMSGVVVSGAQSIPTQISATMKIFSRKESDSVSFSHDFEFPNRELFQFLKSCTTSTAVQLTVSLRRRVQHNHNRSPLCRTVPFRTTIQQAMLCVPKFSTRQLAEMTVTSAFFRQWWQIDLIATVKRVQGFDSWTKGKGVLQRIKIFY